jgi:hypothetical protein
MKQVASRAEDTSCITTTVRSSGPTRVTVLMIVFHAWLKGETRAAALTWLEGCIYLFDMEKDQSGQSQLEGRQLLAGLHDSEGELSGMILGASYFRNYFLDSSPFVSLFWKKIRRLMRSPCCLCVCMPPSIMLETRNSWARRDGCC